jgi:competence protein ComFC
MIGIDTVLKLIAPHNCLVCGKEGTLICAWCEPDVTIAIPSRCYKCFKLTEDFGVCASHRSKIQLKNLWVSSSYEGKIKELLYLFKFGRTKDAASIIATLISCTLPFLPKEILITHVPTATSRRRHRGFDQSELIAKELAKICNLKHERLLSRVGHTRQVGAKRQIRKKQMNNAFRVTNRDKIIKQQVLIVDDIVTTGATMEAAARILRKNGAKKVFAAALAQKQ